MKVYLNSEQKELPEVLTILNPEAINDKIKKEFIGKEIKRDNILLGKVLNIDDKGQLELEILNQRFSFSEIEQEVLIQVRKYYEQEIKFQKQSFSLITKTMNEMELKKTK